MYSGCTWAATLALFASDFVRNRCLSSLPCWASLQYSSRTRAFRIRPCILPCYHCIGTSSLVSRVEPVESSRSIEADLGSDALHLFRRGHDPIRDPARPCLLLPLDLCGFRQRQLLLCHHSRLESRPLRDCRGFTLRRPSRRMGGRKAGDERQRRQTDIATQ